MAARDRSLWTWEEVHAYARKHDKVLFFRTKNSAKPGENNYWFEEDYRFASRKTDSIQIESENGQGTWISRMKAKLNISLYGKLKGGKWFQMVPKNGRRLEWQALDNNWKVPESIGRQIPPPDMGAEAPEWVPKPANAGENDPTGKIDSLLRVLPNKPIAGTSDPQVPPPAAVVNEPDTIGMMADNGQYGDTSDNEELPGDGNYEGALAINASDDDLALLDELLSDNQLGQTPATTEPEGADGPATMAASDTQTDNDDQPPTRQPRTPEKEEGPNTGHADTAGPQNPGSNSGGLDTPLPQRKEFSDPVAGPSGSGNNGQNTLQELLNRTFSDGPAGELPPPIPTNSGLPTITLTVPSEPHNPTPEYAASEDSPEEAWDFITRALAKLKSAPPAVDSSQKINKLGKLLAMADKVKSSISTNRERLNAGAPTFPLQARKIMLPGVHLMDPKGAVILDQICREATNRFNEAVINLQFELLDRIRQDVLETCTGWTPSKEEESEIWRSHHALTESLRSNGDKLPNRKPEPYVWFKPTNDAGKPGIFLNPTIKQAYAKGGKIGKGGKRPPMKSGPKPATGDKAPNKGAKRERSRTPQRRPSDAKGENRDGNNRSNQPPAKKPRAGPSKKDEKDGRRPHAKDPQSGPHRTTREPPNRRNDSKLGGRGGRGRGRGRGGRQGNF